MTGREELIDSYSQLSEIDKTINSNFEGFDSVTTVLYASVIDDCKIARKNLDSGEVHLIHCLITNGRY